MWLLTGLPKTEPQFESDHLSIESCGELGLATRSAVADAGGSCTPGVLVLCCPDLNPEVWFDWGLAGGRLNDLPLVVVDR